MADAGEVLELGMPGDVDDSDVYYIRIDRVSYSDGSHPGDEPGSEDLWPVEADGTGLSLQKISVDEYGNDPSNWTAAVPTPGR